MEKARHESIELVRVSTGHDLWPAIEAAQYAHAIDHDPPETDAEGRAISAFIESFTDHVEEWEQRAPEAQSSILDDLGRQLNGLAEQGLFLYWATVEREVATASGEPARLPIALVKIARRREPVLHVAIEIDAGGE